MPTFSTQNESNSEQVLKYESNEIKPQDEIYLDLQLNSNQIELFDKLKQLISEQSVNFSNNKTLPKANEVGKVKFKQNVTINDFSTFIHLSPTQLVHNFFKLFYEYKFYFLIIFFFVLLLFISFLSLFYTFYALIKQNQSELMKNKRMALSLDVIDNLTRLNNSKQFNSQNLIDFFKVQTNKTSLGDKEVENKTLDIEQIASDNAIISKSNENFYNFSFLSQERTIKENGQPTNNLKFQTFCVRKN